MTQDQPEIDKAFEAAWAKYGANAYEAARLRMLKEYCELIYRSGYLAGGSEIVGVVRSQLQQNRTEGVKP